MRINSIISIFGVFALLGGCAHPISIAPSIPAAESKNSPHQLVNAKIGYYIPDEALSREVTTPGGGGDNVRYFPYRDAEAGYRKMLENTFTSVSKVPQPTGSKESQANELSFVIEPELVTNSGSTGFFTWPPTNFSVDLTSRIRDSSGKLLASPRVIGAASVGSILDMSGNFGITGQNAMADALLKMQTSLVEVFNDLMGTGGSNDARIGTVNKTADRLTSLKELLERRLIDPAEYEKKRKEILDNH